MSDKVFTKKMTMSICLILLCLCALSISAGAFFIESKNSTAKSFTSATYDLKITSKHTVITDNTTNPVTTQEQTVAQTADKIYTLAYDSADVDANGYNVTVQFDSTARSETAVSTASGYCKIIITDGNDTVGTFYTKQIGRADTGDGKVKTLRGYELIINRDVTVTFIQLWGTYAHDDALADGSVITVPATGNATAVAP